MTQPTLRDTRPAFDPEGKYLYFIGQRDFDPVYDELHFDLGFPKGSRPFAITLRKDAAQPVHAAPQAAAEQGSRRRSRRPRTKRRRPRRRTIEIELDGITERVLAFPVPESALRPDRRASRARRCIRSYPIEGARGRGGDEDAGRARRRSTRTTSSSRSPERLVDGDLRLLGRPRRQDAAVPGGDRLRVLKAGEKAPDKKDGDKPGRESGWIDLGRVKVSIEPARRVAADVPRGVAPAARAVLDRGHVGHRLGRGLRALPAAASIGSRRAPSSRT